MKTFGYILAFINGAWGLIFKLAIVILVIVGIVAFIQSCTANATLSEHSSCQQFEQADTDTQNKVLQDMLNAHHDQSGLSVTRFSVTLYCETHDDSSPIDGVYDGGNVGQFPAQALHTAASMYGGQAWSIDAV